MSYRVGTPNYNLPQTEGSDKRDWTDTNQAFLAIDTAIKNAVDTSASASSAASTAQQTADGANTAAAHAQTDATTAQNLANSANEQATIAKNRADAAYSLAESATEVVKIADSDIAISSGTDGYTVNPFCLISGNIITLGCTVQAGTQAVAFQGRTLTFPESVKTTTDGGWYAVPCCSSGAQYDDAKAAFLKGRVLDVPASANLRNIAIYTITYVRSPYPA